ncbi:MAG: hypothetical protein WCC00_01150 [Candidatus Aminicenantales bacterium]
MKRSPFVPIIALAALFVLAGAAFSQAPKKADIVGTWVGTAMGGDGATPLEITAVIDKTAVGYSGKLGDTAGMVPESAMREIVFKDDKLTFDFDLAQGTETLLIKIELTLEAETLKGVWSDPDGNSGAIELKLKK